MQTKQEIISKVNDVAASLPKAIVEECTRLLNCGALDLEEADPNSFVIPKVILVVALENMAAQYYPSHSARWKTLIENLRHF